MLSGVESIVFAIWNLMLYDSPTKEWLYPFWNHKHSSFHGGPIDIIRRLNGK